MVTAGNTVFTRNLAKFDGGMTMVQACHDAATKCISVSQEIYPTRTSGVQRRTNVIATAVRFAVVAIAFQLAGGACLILKVQEGR